MPVQFKILNNIYSVNDHLNRFGRTCAKMAEGERGEEHMGASYYSQATHSNCLQVHKASHNQTATAIAARSVAVPVTADSRQQEQQQEMLIPSQFREASTQSCYDCCCDCCRCLCRLPTENGDRRSASKRPKERESERERPEQRRHSVRQMPITV